MFRSSSGGMPGPSCGRAPHRQIEQKGLSRSISRTHLARFELGRLVAIFRRELGAFLCEAESISDLRQAGS